MAGEDGRTWAWMSAWLLIQHAQNFRTEFTKQYGGFDLPPGYHVLLREAEILAALTRASDRVGSETGMILEQRRQADAESYEFNRRLREEIFKGKDGESDESDRSEG